jgi:hypothetical protein
MSASEPFQLTEDQKKAFAGIYLLEFMINEPVAFNLLLEREDADLEPVLEWLLVKEYVTIVDEERYTANRKGRDVLKRFLERYSQFLHFFDVFSAVDLAAGEFAFASYPDFDSEAEWKSFLNDERWEDLRVTVASYKRIDPVEIVFMSFIQEKRFGRDASGWQFDLLLGSVWEEILGICNSALKVDQLGYETEEGVVSGEDVLNDVIEQGFALIDDLHGKEATVGDDFGSEHYRSHNYDFQPMVDPVKPKPPGKNAFRKFRDSGNKQDDWDRMEF